ncbi:hypothetical protein SAMN05216337_1017126 [Bradyrhizobium brasilense]|uniref:Uncharacterized protein n=1 Tax=Bradyrhizobium brasilense TaxID=1419277 RepID=A0A1G6YYU6_9BRAD|nr:hypothetical protein [Bradyrhizobium brasilense]SDD94815.1 hypothetical protein SAMN05216337_1017126 [Bradyrhizobium brasilense]
MGQLTEQEVFDCIGTNAKLAAEHCEALAREKRKGLNYDMLRKELKLIEGACRQAAYFRQDARWLPIGLMMEEAHNRAGEWLRGVRDPITRNRKKIPEGTLHPLFMKLAENLRALHRQMDELRTKATGRVGMILPKPLAAPHRDTVPVGYTKSMGGVLIPESIGAA